MICIMYDPSDPVSRPAFSGNAWRDGGGYAYDGPRPLMDRPPAEPARGVAWAWWVVIAAVSLMIFGINFIEKAGPALLPDPANDTGMILRFSARYAIGARELGSSLGAATPAQDLMTQIDDQPGTVIDRLRAVGVAGELLGKEAALERLALVDQALDADLRVYPENDPSAAAAAPPQTQWVQDQAALDALREDAMLLRRLYESSAASLDQAERDRLTDRHHWFAELALAHEAPSTDAARKALLDDARAMVMRAVAAAGALIVAGVAGIGLFVLAAVALARGALRPAFPPSRAPFDTEAARRSNVFLEMFGLFLLGFIALSFVGGAIQQASGVDLSFGLMWSLGVLAFVPLTRGMSWAQLRAALGWHAGPGSGPWLLRAAREAALGVLAHLAGLPIIGIGIVLTLVIVAVSGADPSHPIAGEVDLASGWAAARLVILATIWAPLVEETFFRGAFYFHLRRRWGVLASGLVCGGLFALIHPQGYAAVPVLTALGLNFCLMREWRGSLIAPITAHALNNGFVIMLLLFVILD